jgi:hypothetical protein
MHQLLWVKIANNYLKSNSCANLNYVSPHFGGETYCFCPVRLSVSATYVFGEVYAIQHNLCDKVCQWLAEGRWFSPGTQVSSTNTTDHQDIAEILLKVILSTITLTLPCLSWFKRMLRDQSDQNLWQFSNKLYHINYVVSCTPRQKNTQRFTLYNYIRFNIGTPKFQNLFQLILTILKHIVSYSYKRLSMGVIFVHDTT